MRPSPVSRYRQAWQLIVLCVLTGLIPILTSRAVADDHNYDTGAGIDTGVATPWDSESVDPLNGNLNLSIPLYKVPVGPGLDMSIELVYNSLAWGLEDRFAFNPYGERRHLRGISTIGAGWSLNLPSIQVAWHGTDPHKFYYFQSQDGGRHRLFRENCTNATIWYTNDDSGIKVQSTANGFTAWLPNGQKIILNRSFPGLLRNIYNGYYVYDSWYPTRIESATNNSSLSATHWINIDWWPPSTLHLPNPLPLPDWTIPVDTWHCPKSMIDSYGRTITFECKSAPHPYPGTGNEYQDGGTITSITVPAPPDPDTGGPRLRRYDLVSDYQTLTDPFTLDPCPVGSPECDPVWPQEGISMLHGIEAREILLGGCGGEECDPTPVLTYSFDYDASGALQEVVLPGGGRRTYDFAVSKSWIRDYPPAFDGSGVEGQFSTYGIYGVRSRSLETDGRMWTWHYLRSNDTCTSINTDQCWDHPHEVTVTGPGDLLDPSVLPSTVVYKYNATKKSGATTAGGSVTPGTVAELDGTLRSVEVYAGLRTTGRLVRKTDYDYAFTTPPTTGCLPDESPNDHYADNVRLQKVTTSYEDDWKAVHDKRVVEYLNYSPVVHNVWLPQETREYLANGTTLYRKTTRGFTTSSDVNGAVIPKTEWVRILKADGTVLSESRAKYNSYGQLEWLRRLYSPGASPGFTSPNDLVTTVGYDPTTGFPDHAYVGTGSNLQAFGETYEWTYGVQTSREAIVPGVPWKSEDRTVDFASGAVLEERAPWGGGQRFSYDAMGRVIKIEPISGPGTSATTIDYSGNQVTTTVGDVQEVEIKDGLGRTRELRRLKLDDNSTDQWVSQSLVLDWAGDAQTISEWAPVGATGVPVTRIERYGLFKTSSADAGIVAVDPFRRVHRVIAPDGSQSRRDYQGLVTTRTTVGVQGGTVAQPSLFDQVVTETEDIFGRVTESAPMSGPPSELKYYEDDRLDRIEITSAGIMQVRKRTYDHLGRVIILEEPERGKTWFGSHTSDIVQPDGYDALGNQVRYQTATGATETTPYHYRMTYDQFGRLTLIEKETDGGERTRISEFQFDLESNGKHGTTSHLGRLGRSISYDDAGGLRYQGDNFYQDAFGRLDRTVASFGIWSSPQTTTYTYDALGAIASVQYPSLAGSNTSTQVSYSRTRGTIQQVGSNRGPIVTASLYNDAGGLKQWTAFSGVKTQMIPDPMMKARVKQYRVTSGIGSTMWSSGEYLFDGGGNISQVGSDVYTYDNLGRLKQGRMLGATGSPFYSQEFQYDAFGNLSSKSLQVEGGVSEGTVFNMNLTTNRVRGLGTATNWEYRDDGALIHDDTFDYGYDNAGRLSQIQYLGNSVGRYGYDATGKRVYRREDHGKEIFYFRDGSGNLLSQFTRPTGSTGTPQWDRDFVYLDALRVAMIANPQPAGTAWKVTSSGGSGISLGWYQSTDTDAYGYLVLRQGPGETEFTPLFATGLAISTTAISYVDTTAISGQTYQYKMLTVDTAGNQGPASIVRTITRGDTTSPPSCSSLSAQPGNGVVSLQWAGPASPPADFAGYYLYRKVGNGAYGSPLNAYPFFDTSYEDLGVTNGTTYKYIVKSVDTAGLTSSASNEVSAKPTPFGPIGRWERSNGDEGEAQVAAGATSGENSAYRVIGDGALPQIFYLHSDHLGTLRFMTDYSGLQVAVHKYLPFGEEAQVTQSSVPFGYAGYEYDSEHFRNYVGARYYSPSSTRWATPDPLGGGYIYANNSPISFNDPTGLDAVKQVCVIVRVCTEAPGQPRSCEDENRCHYEIVKGPEDGVGPQWDGASQYYDGRQFRYIKPQPPIRETPSRPMVQVPPEGPSGDVLLETGFEKNRAWQKIFDGLTSLADGVATVLIESGEMMMGGIMINPALVGGPGSAPMGGQPGGV